VQQFLGFANFYWWFIEGYSRIANPLTNLTVGASASKQDSRKGWTMNEDFVFGAEAKEALEWLKGAFCEAPVLRHFNPEQLLRVETNASNFTISGILS
jgi:hypothetical protein